MRISFPVAVVVSVGVPAVVVVLAGFGVVVGTTELETGGFATAGVDAAELETKPVPTTAEKSNAAGIVPEPSTVHLQAYSSASIWRHLHSAFLSWANAGRTSKRENNTRNTC